MTEHQIILDHINSANGMFTITGTSKDLVIKRATVAESFKQLVRLGKIKKTGQQTNNKADLYILSHKSTPIDLFNHMPVMKQAGS